MSRLFPEFIGVIPVSLRRAVDELLYESTNGRAFETRWKSLIERLAKEDTLTATDKIIGLSNYLSLPEYLRTTFRKLFLQNLDVETLRSASASSVEMLWPNDAIRLICADDVVQSLGREHVTDAIFQGQSWLGDELKESEALGEIVGKKLGLSGFISSFSGRTDSFLGKGQKRLLLKCVVQKEMWRELDHNFDGTIRLLRRVGEEEPLLVCLDKIVQSYFLQDSSWATKIFNESFFLHLVVRALPALRKEIDPTPSVPALDRLESSYREILNALAMLNAAEPDRGEFWKAFIPHCDEIEPKRIDKTTVATAFIFRSFVVVDYGPKGNAALLYRRKDFDENIRRTARWRDLDFTWRLSPFTSDGRLEHHPGWQRKFTHLISALMRQGQV